MASLVYTLCALTSLLCAVLLLKSYAREKARLLLWSGLCFICLALGNIILFFDLAVIDHMDLSSYRTLCNLAGVLTLLYGLIWEAS
jgi:hypothetical protein